MSKTAIQVEHLSKAYRVGQEERKADTLSGALLQALKAPLRNFKTLRNLRDVKRDEASLFWALKDVNFEVKEGEVLGIIGHNGAGKSTLLKILSRITEPTEGRITIHGRVSSLLEVGTGFHPDLTGRENIYMNGTILGMRKKEIDQKLDEIIAFSGISQHIDTPVKRYSSGMTVRLAFSVAAHLEPEILIIDEVLAVGDMEFQKKCLGKMKDVSGQGRTVLFVSHNMPAVQTLCNRAILLNKGSLIYEGKTEQVIAQYLKKFSASKASQKWICMEEKSGCYFKEIEIVPVREEIFTMGNDILIKTKIISDFDFNQFQICIRIYDENYILVSCLYNTDFLIGYSLLIGVNYFQLIIKLSNLLPGTYYLSFTAMYNYGHQIFDKVDDAIKIEITAKDLMESGRPFLKDRGIVWFMMDRR